MIPDYRLPKGIKREYGEPVMFDWSDFAVRTPHWGMFPQDTSPRRMVESFDGEFIPEPDGKKLDLSKPSYEVAVRFDANRMEGAAHGVWQGYKFGPYLP